MKVRAGVVVWGLLLLSGCNPYDRRSGEYSAGPVDVSHFPAAYLGAGGDAKRGGGVFQASAAFVDGDGDRLLLVPVRRRAARRRRSAGARRLHRAEGLRLRSGRERSLRRQARVRGAGRLRLRRAARRLSASTIRATCSPRCPPTPATRRSSPRCRCSRTASRASRSRARARWCRAPTSWPCRCSRRPRAAPPDALPTGVPDGRLLAWAIVDPAPRSLPRRHARCRRAGLGPQKIGWFDHYL